MGHIQVYECRLNFSVELRFHVSGIQLDDQRKARSFLVDVLDRFGLPPSGHRVDGEEISARKIRSGTTKLVDMQGADVTPVTPENPTVIVGYRLCVRVIGKSVDP